MLITFFKFPLRFNFYNTFGNCRRITSSRTMIPQRIAKTRRTPPPSRRILVSRAFFFNTVQPPLLFATSRAFQNPTSALLIRSLSAGFCGHRVYLRASDLSRVAPVKPFPPFSLSTLNRGTWKNNLQIPQLKLEYIHQNIQVQLS